MRGMSARDRKASTRYSFRILDKLFIIYFQLLLLWYLFSIVISSYYLALGRKEADFEKTKQEEMKLLLTEVLLYLLCRLYCFGYYYYFEIHICCTGYRQAAEIFWYWSETKSYFPLFSTVIILASGLTKSEKEDLAAMLNLSRIAYCYYYYSYSYRSCPI